MSLEQQTKARLIRAAGEEFAEKGFEGATVRSICNRAGTNLAAVNYHFGDKTQLYEQALLEAHRCERFDQLGEVFVGLTPIDQFRSYVRWFLENIFDQDSDRGWQRALMLRELIQPTTASDVLVKEAIRPRFERLKSILRNFCPDVDEKRLNAMAFSVVGQILHYKIARTISERLIGAEAYASLDVAFLVDHISQFCLAAFGQLPALGESTDGEPALASLVKVAKETR